MVTGSLKHFGEKGPSEIVPDVPSWLDDLTLKCTKKDRRDRYLNTEEVSQTLMKLKGEL